MMAREREKEQESFERRNDGIDANTSNFKNGRQQLSHTGAEAGGNSRAGSSQSRVGEVHRGFPFTRDQMKSRCLATELSAGIWALPLSSSGERLTPVLHLSYSLLHLFV